MRREDRVTRPLKERELPDPPVQPWVVLPETAWDLDVCAEASRSQHKSVPEMDSAGRSLRAGADGDHKGAFERAFAQQATGNKDGIVFGNLNWGNTPKDQVAQQRQAEELADMMGRSLAFSRFRIGQLSCDFYSTVSSGS